MCQLSDKVRLLFSPFPLWRLSIPEEVEQRGIYVESPLPQCCPLPCDYVSKPPPLTCLSWLANMSRLSALINESEEFAAGRALEGDFEPTFQVSVLREDLKKQQERCAALLSLMREYADRFLPDISEETQQQCSLLEALERRLDMAKRLREEAVYLRVTYDGTLDCIKKLLRTGV
jgi:hypothetical protein